jgi:hypothetical protein
MRHRRTWRGLVLISTLAPAACVNGTLPRHSTHDPAHPAAPEGYAAVELTAMEDAKRDHAGSVGSQAEATLYVCPMHPEVVSSTPGTCPKCGMNLVPKPAPPKQSPSATP